MALKEFTQGLNSGLTNMVQMQFLMGKEGNLTSLEDARHAKMLEDFQKKSPEDKEELLKYAPDFLTKDLKIPAERAVDLHMDIRDSASQFRMWRQRAHDIQVQALNSGDPQAVAHSIQQSEAGLLELPGVGHDMKSVSDIMGRVSTAAQHEFQTIKYKRELAQQDEARKAIGGELQKFDEANSLPQPYQKGAVDGAITELEKTMGVKFNPGPISTIKKMDPQDRAVLIRHLFKGLQTQNPHQFQNQVVNLFTKMPDSDANAMLHGLTQEAHESMNDTPEARSRAVSAHARRLDMMSDPRGMPWMPEAMKIKTLQSELNERELLYNRLSPLAGNQAAQSRADDVHKEIIDLRGQLDKMQQKHKMNEHESQAARELYPQMDLTDATHLAQLRSSPQAATQIENRATDIEAAKKAKIAAKEQEEKDKSSLTPLMKEMLAEGIVKGSKEWNDTIQKHIDKENAPSSMMMYQEHKVEPDRLRTMAEQVVSGMPIGQVMGGSRNTQLLGDLHNEIQKVMTDKGMTGSQLTRATQEFAGQSALVKEFDSTRPGTAGGNVVNIDTALYHAGSLFDAFEKLNDGNVPAANKALNFFLKETGRPEVVGVELTRAAFAAEMATVFKRVNVDDAEIERWEKNFKTSSSKEQYRHALHTAAELLHGRIGGLEAAWKRVMGGEKQMLSKQSQAALDKLDNMDSTKKKSAMKMPQLGDVVDGYRFKGGDVNEEKNWVKVK